MGTGVAGRFLGVAVISGIIAFSNLFDSIFLSGIFFYIAVSLLVICIPMFVRKYPQIIGKRKNGTINPLSYVIFWPFHLLTRGAFFFFDSTTEMEKANEVYPNLFVGAVNARKMTKFYAVLDLTAEWPEFTPSGLVTYFDIF
jgi:hypothetical protein